MGRIYIALDPANAYHRVTEPGWDRAVTGRRLLDGLTEGPQGSGNFWSPEGSDWLLPKPLHHQPGWYQDTDQANHILGLGRWSFSPQLTVIEREYGSRKPDGTSHPVNQWLFITRIPSNAAALDDTDWTALGAAGGFTLPAGMRTIGVCATTPTGRPLHGEGDYHPYLKWLSYPPPSDWFAFGFGNLAFVFHRGNCYLMRSPDNSRQRWERLGAPIKFGQGRNAADNPRGLAIPTDLGGIFSDLSPYRHDMAVLPVGLDHVYLEFGGAASRYQRLRNSHGEESPGFLFQPGSWWVAAPVGNEVAFQCQVVGYTTADTDDMQAAAFADRDEYLTSFSLGRYYKPTQEPTIEIHRLMHPTDGDAANIGRVTGANAITDTLNDDTEQVAFAVRNDQNAAWVSDGTRYTGAYRVRLAPGSLRAGAPYLAPQLRAAYVKFPVKREARLTDELVLDDTQFHSLTVETSLREILGKRIRFSVDDPNHTLLVQHGLDVREGFPVHVLDEVTLGDPASRVIRARGWVREINLLELKTESSGTGAAPLKRFDVIAHGILSRLDEEWLHRPQVVDTENGGQIEHTFAIQDTLKKSGFDIADTALFVFHTDPFAGTDVARLPGSDPDMEGVEGVENDGAWHPDWTEPRIQYIDRIATQWRGWSCYETGALVRYHPDIAQEAFDGQLYHVTATIHRTKAEATAAGAPAAQCFRIDPTRYVERMPCNVIRITGKDPQANDDPNEAVHLLDRYTESIELLNVNTRNDFLGEERILTVVSKLGVGSAALARAGRVLLRRKARRIQGWNARVMLAPWQFSTALDVGHVVTLRNRGDHVITRLAWTLLGRGAGAAGTYVYQSTLTCERLPQGSTAGTSAGAYPGAGVE